MISPDAEISFLVDLGGCNIGGGVIENSWKAAGFAALVDVAAGCSVAGGGGTVAAAVGSAGGGAGCSVTVGAVVVVEAEIAGTGAGAACPLQGASALGDGIAGPFVSGGAVCVGQSIAPSADSPAKGDSLPGQLIVPSAVEAGGFVETDASPAGHDMAPLPMDGRFVETFPLGNAMVPSAMEVWFVEIETPALGHDMVPLPADGRFVETLPLGHAIVPPLDWPTVGAFPPGHAMTPDGGGADTECFAGLVGFSEEEPASTGGVTVFPLADPSDCWLCAFQLAAAKNPRHQTARDVNLSHWFR